jgi:hypothetical protein
MKDIIKMADDLKEFVTMEDGFVYWWPSSQGTISSHDLRTLADELDRRNEVWQIQLNDFFNDLEKKQERLPVEFEKAINENLDKLYEK